MNASTRPLGELLEAAGLERPAGLSDQALAEPVSAVVCDSRKAVPGCLFVALPGHATEGILYVEDALKKGCRAVLAERGQTRPEWGVACIETDSAREALVALAGAWYGHPARQLCCIGITGTNGKTTTAWLIEGMLLEAGFRPGVIGTVNYRYHDAAGAHVLQKAALTTPDALTLQALLRQMADAGVTHLIMEISSHSLDQGRVEGLLFDVAIFTNLTRDHLDYHKDMERYFAAKRLLFTKYMALGGTAVIDVDAPGEDTPWGERLASGLRETEVLRTGLDARCDIRAETIHYGFDGFSCALIARDQETTLRSALVGAYNVRNVLGAVGAGLALRVPLERIRAGIAAVRAVPGRLERVLPPGAGKQVDAALFPAVFVDYAHTPDALDNVLRTLSAIRGKGRLICVFGCGGDRDAGKRPQMGAAAVKYSDIVLVTSDNPRTEDAERIIDAILPGLAGARECPPDELFSAREERSPGPRFARLGDRGRAIRLACGLARPQDIVLISGKGHEDYQIIGQEKQYFDDRVAAMNALAAWNARLLLAATAGRGATLTGPRRESGMLGQIRTDSRQIAPGDIFVALKGENFDGHDFIMRALDAGAGAVVAERFPEEALASEQALCLEVGDSLAALGDLAHFRRELFAGSLKVAAITGSSGKTTVKEMLAAICDHALKDDWAWPEPVLKTGGNFNNLIGLPLSLLPLNAGHRVAVLEMGMSAPGEIDALTRIADPDVACVSTVHPAHLQGLGSIEGVARAKGELFRAMRPEALRVVNEDDPRIRREADEAGGKRIGFALTEAGLAGKPQVRVDGVRNLGEQGLELTLRIGPWSKQVRLAALGEHNAHNAAAAAALAHGLGIAPTQIAEGLAAYRPSVGRRLAVTELAGGVKLVNDVYNANPASMAAGLRALAALARHAERPGKTLAVLGDMLELGETSPQLHREVGALAAELGFSLLAATGERARDVLDGALAGGMGADRARVFPDPQAIGHWCADLIRQGALGRGDWIFVKGSRGMRMEAFIETLEQDGHAENGHAL